jgi:phosphoglycolate phosphatase
MVDHLNSELVIFDLDGTLLDSSEDIAWVTNRTLDAFGYPRMDNSLIKEKIGWGVVMLIKQIMPDIDSAKIEEVKGVFLDLYSSHLVVKSELYPGVIETIEHLLSLDKKLAVLTNKPVNLSVRIIDELFKSGSFKLVLGGDSLATKKPDPAPIFHIMETLGVKPRGSVMVGDSPVDVEAGKGAGIATIGAAYGFRGTGELAEAGVDIIIDNFSELKDIII